VRRGTSALKAGNELFGQGLLDHAKKAAAALKIAPLLLPFDEIIAHMKQLEEMEEFIAYTNPGKLRRQIYPAEFAGKALLFMVRSLVQDRRMTSQLAADLFCPGPSFAAGPVVFLASSPRLCDIRGGPSPADVEKILGEGFVGCYVLDLLARGQEPELRNAAETLMDMLGGWTVRLKQGRPGWAGDLSNIATALLCATDGSFSIHQMQALSRIQAASDGPASMVSKALKKAPWDSNVQRVWTAAENAITQRPTLDAVEASLASCPKAREEAAEVLSKLQTPRLFEAPDLTSDALESAMWRMLSDQYASFESQQANTNPALEVAQAQMLLGRLQVCQGLQCLEKPTAQTIDAMEAALNARVTRATSIVARRATLYHAVAQLEPDCDAGAEEAEALWLAIAAVHSAAVECYGMALGVEVLGPAFDKLSLFLEATAAIGSFRVGADVGLAAAVCALALADVMGPADVMVEVPSAVGAQRLRMTQLASMLEAMTASAEFDKLGSDFETRFAADSTQIHRRVLHALARLDSIHFEGGDWELPPVVAARAIASSYWRVAETTALGGMAAAQAELLRLIEPSWKSQLPGDVVWDDLVGIGERLFHFDVREVGDARLKLKKAGSVTHKQRADEGAAVTQNHGVGIRAEMRSGERCARHPEAIKKYSGVCRSANLVVRAGPTQAAEAMVHAGFTALHEARHQTNSLIQAAEIVPGGVCIPAATQHKLAKSRQP